MPQGKVANPHDDPTWLHPHPNDLGCAPLAARRFELLTAATNSMRGWAKAFAGDTTEGLELIDSGIRGREATGMRLMITFNIALAAEVEHRAGLTQRALTSVNRGLAEAERTGERFYLAELHRLRGEFLMALAPDRAAEAEACLVRAVEVARGQGAGLLEERALESLVRLRQRLQVAR